MPEIKQIPGINAETWGSCFASQPIAVSASRRYCGLFVVAALVIAADAPNGDNAAGVVGRT
jgi:hypothetical protein